MKIFLNQIAVILELAAIATLKRKDGNIPGMTALVHIDKGFPPCCLLLTLKFKGRGHIFEMCS